MATTYPRRLQKTARPVTRPTAAARFPSVGAAVPVRGAGGGGTDARTDGLVRGERQFSPESSASSQAWRWTPGRGLALDLPSSEQRRARETNSFLPAAQSLQGTMCLPAPAPNWPPGLRMDPPPILPDHLLLTPQRHTLSTPRHPRGGKHHLNSAEDSKSPRDVRTSERGLHLLPNATSPHSGSHAPV